MSKKRCLAEPYLGRSAESFKGLEIFRAEYTGAVTPWPEPQCAIALARLVEINHSADCCVLFVVVVSSFTGSC